MAQAIAESITRRSILTGAAIVAAASTLAVPALAAHPDAEIFTLAERIRAASERSAVAYRAFTVAKKIMAKWKERNPRPAEPIVRSFEDMADYGAASREYSAAMAKWMVDLRNWSGRATVARQECRFAELKATWKDALNERGNRRTDLMLVTATTIEGIKCKASLHERDEAMADSIVADLLELNT